jgi:hypothetical protein
MASERVRPRAPPFVDPPGYARHRPEATLLYQLVERYYSEFATAREATGRPLPKYVQEEFEAYQMRPSRARLLARALRGLPRREARRVQL